MKKYETPGPNCTLCEGPAVAAEDEAWKFWLCLCCGAGQERDDD